MLVMMNRVPGECAPDGSKRKNMLTILKWLFYLVVTIAVIIVGRLVRAARRSGGDPLDRDRRAAGKGVRHRRRLPPLPGILALGRARSQHQIHLRGTADRGRPENELDVRQCQCRQRQPDHHCNTSRPSTSLRNWISGRWASRWRPGTWSPPSTGTKATWGFTSKLDGIAARWFGLMFDTWIGADYEKGLAKLKVAAEKP